MEKKNIKKALLTVVLALVLVFTTVMGTLAYLTSQEVVTNTFTVGNVKITLDEAKVNEKGEPLTKTKDAEGKDKYEKAEGNDVVARVTPAAVNDQVYHLVPGRELVKDPTVTLLGESENAYVRVWVKFMIPDGVDADGNPANIEEDDLKALATALLPEAQNTTAPIVLGDNWTLIGEAKADETANTVTYEFRYNVEGNYVVSAKADTDNDGKTEDNELTPVFSKINVPSSWDNDTLAKYTGMTISVTAQAIQAETFTDADDAWKNFPNT